MFQLLDESGVAAVKIGSDSERYHVLVLAIFFFP